MSCGMGGRNMHRIAFDQPVGLANDLGGKSCIWSEVFSTSGMFRYVAAGSGEDVRAGRHAGVMTYKVKIRATSASKAITTDYQMRTTADSVVFNVSEVDILSERGFVWLEVRGPVVR